MLKITLGAQVVMKGKKVWSLYELTGSTIKGCACISSSMKEANHTKLWHLRLEHMSERRLLELSNKGLLGSQAIGSMEFYEHCVLGQ